MSKDEIALLHHELLLRGVNMDIPKSVHRMEWDKALSICLDLYAGFTFQQAIVAYGLRTL